MHSLKHGEVTENILRCAFEVHNFLGCGFQEAIYQRALEIEFNLCGVAFEREPSSTVYYKSAANPIGTFRVDFLVAESVIVELKAASAFEDVHLAQILNYMKVYKKEVGLLLNFGTTRLTYKRVVRSKEFYL